MTLQFTAWNADRLLRRKPRRILSDYGDLLGPQLQNEIAKPQFTWPNVTRRINGRVVGSPRDIVDTGRFIDSQTEPRVSEDEGGVSMTIGWTEPYAADIYKGVVGDDYVSAGGVIQTTDPKKARDWITPALKAQPFRSYFFKRWQELEGGSGA